MEERRHAPESAPKIKRRTGVRRKAARRPDSTGLETMIADLVAGFLARNDFLTRIVDVPFVPEGAVASKTTVIADICCFAPAAFAGVVRVCRRAFFAARNVVGHILVFDLFAATLLARHVRLQSFRLFVISRAQYAIVGHGL